MARDSHARMLAATLLAVLAGSATAFGDPPADAPVCLYRKAAPALPVVPSPAPAGQAPYRIVNRFHIVRRSDGQGGLPEHLVDLLMRDLNYGFRDRPMRFVREPQIVYIDDDALYGDIPTPQALWAVFQQYAEDGVIGWFLSPTLFGGTAVGYTSPGGPQFGNLRGQALTYAAVGKPTNIVTPPHEMGHVFSLWHPYETQFGTECTSGSNCSIAGDLLCDTPASPALGSHNTTGTGLFYGSETPPCPGDPPYAPNTRLYMESGWPAGHILRDRFSEDEWDQMENHLLTVSADLLTDAPAVLVDCDGNGMDDVEEILAGDKVDLGQDLVPDVCQTLPQPGDLFVSGMNNGILNRPRFYDGTTGAYRGDVWNGLTLVHQLRFGADGYVYMTRLSLVVRFDVRTARNVDILVDGMLDGAGTFVDLLFDDDGNLLVLDNVSANIRRYDGASGQYLGIFADVSATGMSSPKYMEYGPGGDVYVVGNGALGNTVQVFDRVLGTPLGSFITPGAGGLVAGQGILYHDGLLYVSNGGVNSVVRYDDTGQLVDVFISPGSGGLVNPHGLRFGGDGHLYVASRSTNSVKRYDGASGAYLGDFLAPGAGGPTGTGGLNQPTGLLFCSAAGPVGDLLLAHDDDTEVTTLSWSMPASAAPLLRFDTLRATTPDGFDTASCIEQDGADTVSTDGETPPAGELRYFLVRPENVCGPATAGTDSGGTPRQVADCP